MRKAIILTAILVSSFAESICAQTNDGATVDKSRIKYFEMSNVSDYIIDKSSVPMGDVDEMRIILNFRYRMIRLFNNNFGKSSFFYLTDNDDLKRVDFRFIYAEDDELLPPTLTKFKLEDDHSVAVSWTAVSGASSYQLRYVKQRNISEEEFDWDNVMACDGEMTLDADCTDITVDNLHYGSEYEFAIRALGSDGNASEWSVRLPDFTDNKNMKIQTADRIVPDVIKGISDKTTDSFKIRFDLNFNRNDYTAEAADAIEKNYDLNDGKFVVDKILIKDITTQHKKYITLTEQMISDGEVTVTGLEENSWCEVAAVNSKKISEPEALYNIVLVKVTDLMTLDDYVYSLDSDYSIFKSWYNSDFNPELCTMEYTLVLPSDDVIDSALKDARERLNHWGLTRDEAALRRWITEVVFFNKIMPIEDLTSDMSVDYTSIHGRQYRSSAQRLSGDIIRLDRGVVYPIEKLHIPDNVLIYRLKDLFSLYEYCTDEQKSEYFDMYNMQYRDISTDVEAWTPLPEVWPLHENRVLRLGPDYQSDKNGFCLDFTPVKSVEDASANFVIRPYLIPPGSYRLAFGSKQNQNLNINVSVLVNGQVIAKSDGEIVLDTSTTYHYDRGTTLSDCYPEGYDPSEVAMLGGNSKANRYDTDGGLLISEVVIPDIHGDGSPVQIVIRFEGDSWNNQNSFIFNHWCLRPTADFY